MRAIDASKKGAAEPGEVAPNPLISPKNITLCDAGVVAAYQGGNTLARAPCLICDRMTNSGDSRPSRRSRAGPPAEGAAMRQTPADHRSGPQI
jgi:hypothetical protein